MKTNSGTTCAAVAESPAAQGAQAAAGSSGEAAQQQRDTGDALWEALSLRQPTHDTGEGSRLPLPQAWPLLEAHVLPPPTAPSAPYRRRGRRGPATRWVAPWPWG